MRSAAEKWLGGLDPSFASVIAAARRFAGAELARLRGREGVHWVAAKVRDGAPDEQAEHAFVEGCGAVLSLVLAEAQREAAVVSRDGVVHLRLGTRGWVQPFAAVEAILDAEAPVSALRDWLAHAEAEANGKGPLSRVLFQVDAGLQARGLLVREQVGSQYWLTDGTELELRRVIKSTQAGSTRDAERSVMRFLAMLDSHRTGGRRDMDWAELSARVFPRLVPDRFSHDVGAERPRLLASRFCAGIEVVWIERHSDRVRFVRENELEALGVSREQLHSQALDNLTAASQKMSWRQIENAEGVLLAAESRDGLDAARLLLPALRERLTASLGPQWCAAVPHRDTLLVAAADQQEFLARCCREAYGQAPHRISDQVVRGAQVAAELDPAGPH